MVRKYGTPLYIYDTKVLQSQAVSLQDALGGAALYYSLKANPNKHVVETLRKAGCRVEVASKGELERALEAGYSPTDIIFIGPGKTVEELRRASEVGIQYFVVDSEDELQLLSEQTTVREILLRVNPDFEASGGKLTMSGGKPKQFGVERAQVGNFVGRARKLGLDVVGLHYYLGTRFLEASDLVQNTKSILEDAREIQRETDLELRMLDMGGGFGIPYFGVESDLDLNLLKTGIIDCIKQARAWFPKAELAFESGRYLTAECGRLVLQVLTTKTSYGTRFCVCDGGTNLNMAAIGVGGIGKRNFPSWCVRFDGDSTAKLEAGDQPVTVTGPLCTPDDVLLKDVQWSMVPKRGDLVVLDNVGAYGPSASPHSFLGHDYPTEVVV
ncbi:diaminopimelate decarboxylase [Nesterenkonia cremea]|nr:diaminopimelate decarboxylase [Nesterenkonia cremea]